MADPVPYLAAMQKRKERTCPVQEGLVSVKKKTSMSISLWMCGRMTGAYRQLTGRSVCRQNLPPRGEVILGVQEHVGATDESLGLRAVMTQCLWLRCHAAQQLTGSR